MPADPRPLRVVIADDHAVVREGIRQVLGREHGFEVVGEAANGADAVALAVEATPDVIVIDISMPVMSGIAAVEEIVRRQPGARVLVLSIHESEEYATRSARAGARGYLRKDSSPAELREAVRTVHAGGRHFAAAAPGDAAAVLDDAPRNRLDGLTAREREVLLAIAKGASNKEIAGRLNISVRTVESHRDSLMRKLELRGTAALTRFALECRLLDD